jgi:hypothetical protein
MTKEDMLMSLASTMDEDYIVQQFLEMKLKNLDKQTTLRDLFLNSSNEGWGVYLGNMTLENFIKSSTNNLARPFAGPKQVADKKCTGTRHRTTQAEIRTHRSNIVNVVNSHIGLHISEVCSLIQYPNKSLVRKMLKSLVEDNKISQTGNNAKRLYCPK